MIKQKDNLYTSDILKISKVLSQNIELVKYLDLLILEINKLIINNSNNCQSNITTIIQLLFDAKKLIKKNINKRLILENLLFTLLRICNDNVKKVIYHVLL
ncbi:MAG: hypothetical protein LBM22_01395 [Endomicrobium sp.]|jgi:hypothetical protein|nr:hypothetical protein [Endomicrobium sp.]